jgi:hypothetical protein
MCISCEESTETSIDGDKEVGLEINLENLVHVAISSTECRSNSELKNIGQIV